MAIHVSGSIAYDRIMTFPGLFEEHILPEKLHNINVSFLLDRMEEKRGGTAGNIVYTLALLGEKPFLHSAVGKDFTQYGEALEAMGVNLDGVRRLEDDFTACCYIITDRKGNQINGFNPAAMSNPSASYSERDAASMNMGDRAANGTNRDWAVVSPGNMQDMTRLPQYFRSQGVPYVFDPGQQSAALSGEDLISGLSGAACLIGNDYEIDMISRKTGLSRAELSRRAGRLIVTLGEKGSELHDADGRGLVIGAVPVAAVLDPTGAGDAYRAGLLKGLHSGLDMETSAKLGSVCSSFAIEKYGTQEHSFNREQFRQRFETNYGTMPALSS